MVRKLDAKHIESIRTLKRRERKKSSFDDNEPITKNSDSKNSELTIIEPSIRNNPDSANRKLRVGAYVRVSTQDEAQQDSFTSQKIHFQRVVEENPRYELVKIYEDEGISGTQVINRKGFQEMVADAKDGKLDLIITKDIARFGRNAADITATLQFLDTLTPPIPVFFEATNLDTSDGKSKIIISILAALAELESQLKSEAIKAGIAYRMREGTYKFAVNNTLGFERSKHGYIKIVEEEAEIVKYIYNEFIDGASPHEIANALTESGISSPMGLPVWRSSTVKSILSNEKYCGDVLYQKTFTTSYITHKSKRNNGVLRQWHWTNRHKPIIDKPDWEKAQLMLKNSAWRKNSRKIRPVEHKLFVISRIKSGKLAGFYLLDPSWNKDERETFLEVIKAEIKEFSQKENKNYERF